MADHLDAEPLSTTDFDDPAVSPVSAFDDNSALSGGSSPCSDMAYADPFEVRMRFTSQLQHLNASVTSSQKAAHYALKHKAMDEDLHSCILEQLERNSMNNRANIMYFIEHLCDMAQRDNHLEFVRMIQRDILRVVDAVTPEDRSGAANVKVVLRVLNALRQKSILAPETVTEIEGCLKERDTLPSHSGLSPLADDMPTSGTNTAANLGLDPNAADGSTTTTTTAPATANTSGTSSGANGPNGATNRNANAGTSDTLTTSAGSTTRGPKASTTAATAMATTTTGPATTTSNGLPGPVRPDKRQIEQRIEEDRERHKRLRENIWAVDHGPDGDGEFYKLWDEVSDLGEDDYIAAAEEKAERDALLMEWKRSRGEL
ncbi:MAG: hypothetical protein M1825_005079 [Sarcosagium campestre]|nr:MAG: hypothetical protein M1825_005079 [Sarcosagium campestre]